MVHIGHLVLNEVTVASSTEWASQLPGLCFLQLSQGVGYVLLRAAPLPLAEGDVILFCSSSEFSFRASQLADCKLQFFCVLPEMLGGILTMPEQLQLETILREKAIQLRHFKAGESLAQEFRTITKSAESSHLLVLRSRMLLLAASALAIELPQEQMPAATRLNCDARSRFHHLIQTLPSSEIQRRTVTELAELCRCSERHFRRLFRTQFGLSIRSKQMDIRLQKAQQLLTESNLKISQVAIESGFRHLGLFNARFKKRFGVTPSEWRQQAVEKKGPTSLFKMTA